MRPNTPATEHRGRNEGQWAAFIHVSQGQIIYHLVQTKCPVGGGFWVVVGGIGPRALLATLQPDPHHSSPYLPPLALSSLLHARSLRSSRDCAREGRRAVEGSHVLISHFLHVSLLFTAVIFAPHIKRAARNTQRA